MVACLWDRSKHVPKGEMMPITWEEFKWMTDNLLAFLPQRWPTINGREVWVTDVGEE